MRYSLDFLGMGASLLCAVHCMLTPLLISLGALGGLAWLAGPWIEAAFIGAGALLAAWSLGAGYDRHHGRFLPVAIATLGFLLLVAGRFTTGAWEAGLTGGGGVLVATGHLVNWRLGRRCGNAFRRHSPTSRRRLTVSFALLVVFLMIITLSHLREHPEPSRQDLLETVWRPRSGR